jgi:hypothetical protein
MEPIGALPGEVGDANSLKIMVGPCGLEPQTSTVSTAGTAKVRGSHTRHTYLWVGLWVGKSLYIALERTSHNSNSPTVSGVTMASFRSIVVLNL